MRLHSCRNDEPSHGFDNVTVGNISPTLMDRYVSAAQKIARLAVGAPRKAPGGDTFRLPPDQTQEEHVEGLPIGTRGGGVFPYLFPQDGDYEIQVRLARDRNEQVEGLKKPSEVEVLLDKERIAIATVKPPGSDHNAELVDANLKFRMAVKAGPHDLGVTFPKDPDRADRDAAPALSRAFQHAPAPAPDARGLPGFHHGAVRCERSGATLPAAASSSVSWLARRPRPAAEDESHAREILTHAAPASRLPSSHHRRGFAPAAAIFPRGQRRGRGLRRRNRERTGRDSREPRVS